MEDVFGVNPNRPDSPEFWRMSEIMLALDGMAKEDGRGAKEVFEGEMAKAGDPQAIAYMAIQRALRALGITSHAELARNRVTIAAMATLWTEGFIVASKYHRP